METTADKITLALTIIFISITILLVYQHFHYEKTLNEVKKTYNEEQKQCDIVGTTKNYLYIKRNFHDNIDYSNWKLTNLKTKETYDFSLNKDGKGGVVGLKNGEYTLREVSNHCDDGLDINEYYLKFSEDNKSYYFNPTLIDERGVVVLVLDKNGDPVPDVNIKLYDNLAQLDLSAKTNEKGMVGFIDLPINDSNLYYVVQGGITNPRKFFVKIKKDLSIGIKLYMNDEGVLE